MIELWHATLIGVGGALGSVGRYWISILTHDLEIEFSPLEFLSSQFPWGTVLVNAIGSFIIGFFAHFPLNDFTSEMKLFFMIGFCGGFTTFSSFSLQTVVLLQQEEHWAAVFNVGFSVALCMLFTALGWILA
ncbi:putative fluoride ion transporter CrcB [Azospirillaceae bacterium]